MITIDLTKYFTKENEMDRETQIEECRKEIRRLRQVVRDFEGCPVTKAAPILFKACKDAIAVMCKDNLHLRTAPEMSQAAQILATAVCKAEGK
jgi:Holliday junction resolvasome RuvABC endonuclease subunit